MKYPIYLRSATIKIIK